MTIEQNQTNRFFFLTDRWGEENLGSGPLTQDDQAAIAQIIPAMYDEITFVAKDTATGTYGLVFEAAEMGHDESADSEEDLRAQYKGSTVNGKTFDGSAVPALADVVAEIEAMAEGIKARWPDLDVHVAQGGDVFAERACMRAFIPIGSPLIDESQAIGAAMLGDVEPVAAP